MIDLNELEKLLAKATPGDWHIGCQNDALFLTAGRPPALNNDYPWHDAPRVALAKMFGPAQGDCLPVNADANAALIVLLRNNVDAILALGRENAVLKANLERRDKFLVERDLFRAYYEQLPITKPLKETTSD